MKTYDFDRAAAYFADKVAFTTGAHELEVLINGKTAKASYQVVDVRNPADYAAGHVPGAINLPRADWRKPSGLKPDATLYLYCYNQTCHLAAEAAVHLIAQGHRVVEVEGGWDTWLRNGSGIAVTPKSA